jgi:acyl dehydratase
VRVRFDDLEALGALVSDSFGEPGPALRVSQEMIDGFAGITGDAQWIHVDVARASEGPYGGTIAHGFLLLSLLPKLASGSDATIVGHGTVINYGLDSVRFVSPVHAGSEIHCRRRMAHVRRKGPNGTQVTFESDIRVVGGAKPAVICRTLALFMP